jgi:hypothetical protein
MLQRSPRQGPANLPPQVHTMGKPERTPRSTCVARHSSCRTCGPHLHGYARAVAHAVTGICFGVQTGAPATLLMFSPSGIIISIKYLSSPSYVINVSINLSCAHRHTLPNLALQCQLPSLPCPTSQLWTNRKPGRTNIYVTDLNAPG